MVLLSRDSVLNLSEQAKQRSSLLVGSQLAQHSRTTRISVSRSANPRTAVDFPVPRWPIIRTPPKEGSITLRTRPSLIWSWPTIAEKGYTLGGRRLLANCGFFSL